MRRFETEKPTRPALGLPPRPVAASSRISPPEPVDALIRIDDAQVSLRTLAIHGGETGVLAEGPQADVLVYEIELEGDRADMMAARESPGFSDYVRSIWADLEVART